MPHKLSGHLHFLSGHSFPVKKILLTLLVISVLTIPDVLIELLLEIIDVALELLHVAFESFELLLEEVIQHVFHVDKVESQLYVFYILIALGVWLTILAIRKTPTLYHRIKTASESYYQRQKEYLQSVWNSLSALQKVLCLTVYLPLVLYLASFLII